MQTVDVFTPIVDDAYDYGRIAATNAISDVFAMGGRAALRARDRRLSRRPPGRGRAARSCVAAPTWRTPPARPSSAGTRSRRPSRSTVSRSPGSSHPDRIWRNAGARVGDVLVLTKALGTGIVANALRKGAVDDDVLAAAVASMTTLNGAAADAAARPRPACGHRRDRLRAARVICASCARPRACTRASRAPTCRCCPGVEVLARAGLVPGGSRRNRAAADAYADIAAGRRSRARAVWPCDAQTSGGLLAAVAPEHAGAVGWVIGEIVDGAPGRITLV